MSEPVENKTRLVVTDSMPESTDFAPPSDDSQFNDFSDSSGSVRVEAVGASSWHDTSRPSSSTDAIGSFQPIEVPQSNQQTSAPTFAHVGGVDFSNRQHAEAVLKDLSADEFLRLVEGASPEELQSMLGAVDTRTLIKRPSSSPFGRLFDPLDQKDASFLKILGWWESRRLFYNVVVGLTGLCTLMVIRVGSMNHIFSADFWGGVFIMAYAAVMTAFAANVCYTVGCFCDAFARHFWKEKAQDFGPMLYALGLIFSLVVVGAPGLLLLTFIL